CEQRADLKPPPSPGKDKSQDNPRQHLICPRDSAETSHDTYYFGDREGTPRVLRKAGAVQHRQRVRHDFGYGLETAAHRPTPRRVVEKVTSGGRRYSGNGGGRSTATP